MKLAPAFRFFLALGFFLCGGPAAFSAVVEMVADGTPSSTTIGGQVIYTINVFNRGNTTLSGSTLVSDFPRSSTVVRATNDIPADPLRPNANLITVRDGSVTFSIDTMLPGQEFNFDLRLRLNEGGSVTNRLVLTTQAGIERTNIVTTVSTGNADLGVTISGLPEAIIAYDVISYDITVTNNGPNTASAVIVQNKIPTGAIGVDASPATNVTQAAEIITWQVGTMTNGTSQKLRVTIQPTNTANTEITANVQAPNNVDSSTNNNSVVKSLSVQPVVTDTLVLKRGTQRFNRQNALIEETVNVLNVGTTVMPSVRVLVGGLVEPDRLVNMAGTNSRSPFVLSAETLSPGSSRDILVQLFIHDRTFKTNLNMIAMQGPQTSGSTNTPATNRFALTTGISVSDIVLSFPTKVGTNYSVFQSTNADFTGSSPIQIASTNGTVTITNATTSRITLAKPVITNGNAFFRAVENPPTP